MIKGTIGKVVDYYFSNTLYSGEIEGAMIEFFEVESAQELRRRGMNEKELGFFTEWFTHDYKWNNKKTTLENFYHNNPLNLGRSDLQIYKDLQVNQYGAWEVVSVDPGQGLQLENLQTGKKFDVKEYKATFQLHPKDIFYNRLALIDGNWEMVGADSFILGIKFDKTVKDIWRKDKSLITPKNAIKMLNGYPGDDDVKLGQNLPSMSKAEEKLTRTLKKFKIDTFVTTTLIKNWIYNLRRDTRSNSEVIDCLTGLVNFDELEDSSDIDELIQTFNDFYNLSPQKCLKDKSPSQFMAERDPSHKPDFVMNVTPIGHGENLDKVYKKAHDEMRARRYYDALRNFDKYFKELLRRRTTVFYIYRMYANKAICHFACGQTKEGKRMLDIALELNPNYDFGQKLLREYKEGEFKFNIRDGVGKKSQHDRLKLDFSERYYNFIKELGINFITPTLTTSDIKSYDAQGKLVKPGRNDLCYCGSGNKFKKCHGA